MRIFNAVLLIVLLLGTCGNSQTWTSQTNPAPANKTLWGVFFLDSNNGWAVGARPTGTSTTATIIHTSDGGSAWESQTCSLVGTLEDVVFSDLNNGWAVGDKILHTSDGGASWAEQTVASGYWYAVCFRNLNLGWAVGMGGMIASTTNGGTDWSVQTYNPADPPSLLGVTFADDNNGWAVGYNSTIIHTTNGGISWAAQANGAGTTLSGISFVNTLVGTATGDVGVILQTTNGGTSWNAQTSGVSVWLPAVDFTDGNNGTAVGAGGTILRTTNGGTTWFTQTSGTSNGLQSVTFVDANTGWACGANGTVLKTTDGALPVCLTDFTAVVDDGTVVLHWSTATETNNAGFAIERRLIAPQPGNAWISIGSVGGCGTTTTPHGYTFIDSKPCPGRSAYRLQQLDQAGAFTYSAAVEVETAGMPASFSLEQNFPNPFNPQTTIRFSLLTTAAVTLEVFDLLGRRVAVLVKGITEPGDHVATWRPSGTSGLYLYRLTAVPADEHGQPFIRTKMMHFIR